MIRRKIQLIILFSLLIPIFSCDKDEENWDLIANNTLITVMKDYYLWYDQLPSVRASNYNTPVELIEDLRVNPPDRWSYVTTKEEWDSYFNTGTYYGFGFGNAFDEDGNLWILYVFKNSPLVEKGITRGWRIETIEGVTPTAENYSSLLGPNEPGITKTLGFVSPSGAHVVFTFSKAEITMNSVLFDSTYSFGSTKLGYMVLKSFVEPTIAELDECFEKFKTEGINELVVDLRYNGGGLTDVANYLANLIGGQTASGNIFATYFHNSKNTNLNGHTYFSTETNSLSLDRVIFITSGSTASASELVINGLKPFMPVILIGSTTHGKPVGMYAFRYKEFDWIFVPICFTIRNALNEGDFYNGIGVNVQAADDYLRNFGDVYETSFNSCLTYLGVTITKGGKLTLPKKSKVITGRGLYEEIGAW